MYILLLLFSSFSMNLVFIMNLCYYAHKIVFLDQKVSILSYLINYTVPYIQTYL